MAVFSRTSSGFCACRHMGLLWLWVLSYSLFGDKLGGIGSRVSPHCLHTKLRKENEMERINAWLYKPVKGLWISRGTAILGIAGILFVASFVSGLIYLSYVAIAIVGIMIAIALIDGVLWEIRKNRPH